MWTVAYILTDIYIYICVKVIVEYHIIGLLCVLVELSK
jgi:hypothetical protein